MARTMARRNGVYVRRTIRELIIQQFKIIHDYNLAHHIHSTYMRAGVTHMSTISMSSSLSFLSISCRQHEDVAKSATMMTDRQSNGTRNAPSPCVCVCVYAKADPGISLLYTIFIEYNTRRRRRLHFCHAKKVPRKYLDGGSKIKDGQ